MNLNITYWDKERLPVSIFSCLTFKAGGILNRQNFFSQVTSLSSSSCGVLKGFWKNQLFVNNKLYKTSKIINLLWNLYSAGAVTKVNETALLETVPPTWWKYISFSEQIVHNCEIWEILSYPRIRKWLNKLRKISMNWFKMISKIQH